MVSMMDILPGAAPLMVDVRQSGPGPLQAVLANARSKLVFQTSSRDARLLASEFGKRVSDDDFVNLELPWV